jgi:hypothetical protein
LILAQFVKLACFKSYFQLTLGEFSAEVKEQRLSIASKFFSGLQSLSASGAAYLVLQTRA